MTELVAVILNFQLKRWLEFRPPRLELVRCRRRWLVRGDSFPQASGLEEKKIFAGDCRRAWCGRYCIEGSLVHKSGHLRRWVGCGWRVSEKFPDGRSRLSLRRRAIRLGDLSRRRRNL